MSRMTPILYAVTALIQLPFCLALRLGLYAAGVGGATWIALVAGAALTWGLHGRLALFMWDRPISAWRRWLVEQPYVVHWCAALLSLPLFLVLALAAWLGSAIVGSPQLDLGWPALVSYGAGVALSCWGVILRPRMVRVRTVDVTLARLTASFDGFRIVQLSDLHVGSTTPPEQARKWVKMANALRPDLVVVTGDFSTSGERFYRPVAQELAALHAPAGVFAVLGNHDYFGRDAPLAWELAKAGIQVLRNEWVQLEHGGAAITLAGVDDVYTGHADVAATCQGRPPARPCIALAHDPCLFDGLAAQGVDLVLSGHTHGGQILLLGRLWRWLQRKVRGGQPWHGYVVGVCRRGDATLVVNAGLGMTGPPIRLGAPPEILVVRLSCARAERAGRPRDGLVGC